MKRIFIGLSFGLTLISLVAGFTLYEKMFGISTAILIVTVFETLRLSTLFSIPNLSKFYKPFSIILYVMVASLCLFSSIISFNSKIIDNSRKFEIEQIKQRDKDLYEIKHIYNKKITEQINDIRNKRKGFEEKYARFKYSSYRRIIDNLIEQENKILEQENKYFQKIEESNDIWIKNQKAILGIKTESNHFFSNNSVSQAVKELFNISIETTQKLFGIILSLVVEFGIILLAILGMGVNKIKKYKKLGRPKGSKNKKRKVKETKEVKTVNGKVTKISKL